MTIIDRRKIGTNSRVNMLRCMKRYKTYFREQLTAQLAGEKTTNLDPMHEPMFMFNQNTGIYNIVVPGNDKWTTGDVIEPDEWQKFLKMMQGIAGDGDEDSTGAGGGGSNSKGNIQFLLTDAEYRSILFDGLELPNLRKESEGVSEMEITRSGYSSTGSLIDLNRTYENALARKYSTKNPLIREYESLYDYYMEHPLDDEVREKLIDLDKRIKSIGFIDETDVRYRRFELRPLPIFKCVIFFVLDVSGSMGQREREIAKRFCMLTKLFISDKYKECETEWIIFASEAKHVDEHNFFYENESGGTLFMPPIMLQQEILTNYPRHEYNIYTVMLSDSDTGDLTESMEALNLYIPKQEYFIYAHIGDWIKSGEVIEDELCNNDNFSACYLTSKDLVLTEFRKIFWR